MFLSAAQQRCGLVFVLCVCVSLYASGAFCAAKHQEIQGSWVIDLNATAKRSLRVYFGGDDEQDLLAEASSIIFTFDTPKMRFTRKVLGKEEVRHIEQIEEKPGQMMILWLRHIKFPDYIVALPDGRLRYGSDWGASWEFILKRGDGHVR